MCNHLWNQGKGHPITHIEKTKVVRDILQKLNVDQAKFRDEVTRMQ